MALSPASRTVLVTGSAKRLGREIALTLAGAGWQVAVHYRTSQQDAERTSAECARLSGDSSTFRADLDDEEQVRQLIPAVVRHFGRIDALVNSASTFEHDTSDSFGFAVMEKHLRSNAGAPILLAQALHAHIQQRSASSSNEQAPADAPSGGAPGAVVNLLDQKLWNQNPDFFSYTLSKAALEAANTMLALALAPHVRVVGVAPGLTLTSPLMTKEEFEKRHRMALLEQSSTPADVASAVRFALENQSITGTTLLVDGGQHLVRFERDFSLM